MKKILSGLLVLVFLLAGTGISLAHQAEYIPLCENLRTGKLRFADEKAMGGKFVPVCRQNEKLIFLHGWIFQVGDQPIPLFGDDGPEHED